CGGDAPRMKPHPDPLRLALSQLNLPPRAAVYVGDTIEDVQMGKAAGTATVALAGGFSSHETLSGERPDILLDSLDELTPLLQLIDN
ncbi:MAG TPA: HAD-IA family hydrolase, partial [bacterium]|nr:HAD-IA family hydrolase [bacterium]